MKINEHLQNHKKQITTPFASLANAYFLVNIRRYSQKKVILQPKSNSTPMKIIDKIKTFLLGNKKGNDVIIPSETINYNDYDNINHNINRLPQQPLYTFYR